MFCHPGLPPREIESASQFCINCGQWFGLSRKQTVLLADLWHHMHAHGNCALEVVDCKHCGSANTLVPVGKYDLPNTPREKCAVQDIRTKT